jgi:hypothetical protein
MNRTILLAAMLAAAAGCRDNRTSIEVRGRAFPSDFTKCTYSASGDFLLGAGSLDVASGTTPHNYVVALYVQNNTADPSTLTPGSDTAAKAWRPSAVKVRINPSDYLSAFPPSPDLLPVELANRIPVTGNVVEPGGGQQVVVGEIISPQILSRLAVATPASAGGRIVVGVTIEGETLDGAILDTGEWFFPINLCVGCRSGGCADPTKTLSCCPGGPWQDACTCQ